MDYKWDESDLVLGREVINRAGERLIIGYVVGSAHQRRCLIHLSDGAVYRERTKQELVDDLNKERYAPRYVPVEK